MKFSPFYLTQYWRLKMDNSKKIIQHLLVQVDILKNELFELEKLYKAKELELLVQKSKGGKK